MSFSQHLVLWLHVAFVVFTIGPVTLAIMSTPRYIRQRDIRILRYLSRMTFVFTIGSLGVLIAGFALASMLSKAGKPWIIISATLFLVAVVLLGLIDRDQRHAIKALEAASDRGHRPPAAPTSGERRQPPTRHGGRCRQRVPRPAAGTGPQRPPIPPRRSRLIWPAWSAAGSRCSAAWSA